MTTGKTIALTMQIWKDCFTTASPFTWNTFSPELPLTVTVSSFISDTDIIGDLLHDYVYMLQHTYTLSYFLKKKKTPQSHFSKKSYASSHFTLILLASDGYKNGNTGNSTMRDGASGKDLLDLWRDTKAPLSLVGCIVSCMIPGTAAAQGPSWSEEDGMKDSQ